MCKVSLLLCGLLLGGCSITETTDIMINQRPSLVVDYEYINDAGEQTTAQEMAWMDLFVFDPDDHFLMRQHVTTADVKAKSGITLLEGVPEGRYRVLCFANVTLSEFSPLTPGESTPNDLRLGFTAGQTPPSSDRVLYHTDLFAVRRGAPKVNTVQLNKLYYMLQLEINGAQEIRDFTIKFSGAAGFDGTGDPLSEAVVYTPRLHPQPDGKLTGSLAIPRFDDGSKVGMTLLSDDRVLAVMSLSDYLAENSDRINLDSRDVVIPVSISVETSQVRVVVDNWEDGTVQLPILGL